jgi:chemotaxis protein methyltransferase CheR
LNCKSCQNLSAPGGPSAGCATGEEPYSLAMLLARMLPDLADWNISILGTDINPGSLQRAAAGVYTQWSFRECPDGMAEAHFRKAGEREWEVASAIRNLVNFSYLNLVEDLSPSLLNETNALDLIFCRYVLMYFSAEQARRVTARLRCCLVDGGWLVVSSTEASRILYAQFTTVNFPVSDTLPKRSPAGPDVCIHGSTGMA